MGNLTKNELIAKGKTLGLTLKASQLKGEMEKAIAKVEKSAKAKSSTSSRSGEK